MESLKARRPTNRGPEGWRELILEPLFHSHPFHIYAKLAFEPNLVGVEHRVRQYAVFAGAHNHHVLAAVHADARKRDVLRFLQCLKENGVGLLATAVRHYVIRRFKKHGINFRQANRPDDFHVRGSPTLNASQLLTVKRDVLVGLDFVSAENVRSAAHRPL